MTTALLIYAAGAAIAFVSCIIIQGRPVTAACVYVAAVVAALWPLALPFWILAKMLGR